MDEFGIDSQVIYPNAIGIGGQNLVNTVKDPALVLLCVQLYNDALAEMQEESNNRLLPMPIMPAWSIDDVRARGAALRGDGIPRREHDVGSAGFGLPRPRRARRGIRSGTCARTCGCPCTSTSAPARRR